MKKTTQFFKITLLAFYCLATSYNSFAKEEIFTTFSDTTFVSKTPHINSSIENTSFFKGNTFYLNHYLINGEKIDNMLLDTGRIPLSERNPFLEFSLYNGGSENIFISGNKLSISIGAYCNGSFGVIYEDFGDYFSVLYSGGQTLVACGNEENTHFFNPLRGYNETDSNETYKVYYSINVDLSGFKIWSEGNPNHILVFSKNKIANVQKINLEKLFIISPNPSKSFISIQETSLAIEKINLIDLKGKEIKTITESFDKIDTSTYKPGIYFLKIDTKEGSIMKKIIIQ